MDHSKFEDMTKGLIGKSINEQMTEDFEMLDPFQLIKPNFLHVSYATCVKLEVLTKEMMDYEIPTQEQCKVVEKFGKIKYKYHHEG